MVSNLTAWKRSGFFVIFRFLSINKPQNTAEGFCFSENFRHISTVMLRIIGT